MFKTLVVAGLATLVHSTCTQPDADKCFAAVEARFDPLWAPAAKDRTQLANIAWQRSVEHGNCIDHHCASARTSCRKEIEEYGRDHAAPYQSALQGCNAQPISDGYCYRAASNAEVREFNAFAQANCECSQCAVASSQALDDTTSGHEYALANSALARTNPAWLVVWDQFEQQSRKELLACKSTCNTDGGSTWPAFCGCATSYDAQLKKCRSSGVWSTVPAVDTGLLRAVNGKAACEAATPNAWPATSC